MIARDEEANLPRCLESARGLFDEVIILDTGSVDRTREIARSFGARLFEFPWSDDFAAARNAALRYATGDYAFWLDADEMIEPVERQKLRHLLDGLRPTAGIAYTVRVRGTMIPEPGIYQVRLFPNRPDIRWMGSIHEILWPAVRRAGLAVWPGGISVHHHGYSAPVVHAGKRVRNERILRGWLAEHPDDPLALWHMGRLEAGRGRWTVARELYRKSLASWPTDLLSAAPRAYLAQAEWELGDRRAALRTCSESLALSPHHAPAWFARGQMHDCLGESAEAERCWRHVLTLVGGVPERMADYDPLFEARRARRGLAALAIQRGDLGEATRLYAAILAVDPDDHEARSRFHALTRA
jgi:hypothetical protein